MGVKGTKQKGKFTLIVPIPEIKGKAHGKPFRKENPYAYKKGHAPHPLAGRKLGSRSRSGMLSETFRQELNDEAPERLKQVFGVEDSCTVAQIIAIGVAERACLYDTTAVRELREVTEGRLPDTIVLEGQINYTAGKSAKDVLMGKLDKLPELTEGIPNAPTN